MSDFKIVMYHYVRKFDKNIPNLNFLSIETFEKQLDYFEKQFWFIKKEDWIRFSKWEKVDLKWVLLTFDDWLSCHYKYVLPILKKKKLWWIFFIPTWQLKNNRILNVHKIHYLLWKYEIEKLYDILIYVLKSLNIIINFSNQNEYKHQKLDKKTLFFKRINYVFTKKIQDEILNNIFKILNIDENKLFDIFYMNKSQIKELINYWNIIWWHTENHILLSKYKKISLFKIEIYKSNKFLEKEFNEKIYDFAIPYGIKKSYNNRILKILKFYWIKNNFIVNDKDFDFWNNYEISRYDCNSLKFWKFFKN